MADTAVDMVVADMAVVDMAVVDMVVADMVVLLVVAVDTIKEVAEDIMEDMAGREEDIKGDTAEEDTQEVAEVDTVEEDTA